MGEYSHIESLYFPESLRSEYTRGVPWSKGQAGSKAVTSQLVKWHQDQLDHPGLYKGCKALYPWQSYRYLHSYSQLTISGLHSSLMANSVIPCSKFNNLLASFETYP